MAEIIEMPKLSDTQTVGTLVKWLKKTGDKIHEGELIAEIETDKATMELETFTHGILLVQYVSESEEVEIGAPICAIGEEGENPPPLPDKISKVSASAKDAIKPDAVDELRDPTLEKQAVKELEKTSQPDSPPSHPPIKDTSGDRIKASPLARKIAADKGISLEAIVGTGPDGRILKADILAAEGRGILPPAAASSSLPETSRETPNALEKSIPISNMRSVIAKRLLESKITIPHYYLEIEINAAPLLEMRASLNKGLAAMSPETGGIKLTINDFILKASAKTLQQVPEVNVSWMVKTIKQHGGVHLAVAITVEDGLVTPVVRDAHLKSISQISSEVKALVLKAKNKKLSPGDMTGSTFTVTNLGMYGITSFHAIINPPNAAILSVGTIAKKPVVDEKDNISIGQYMTIGFSGDHRVVDGSVGAQYLSSLKDILETPALMMV